DTAASRRSSRTNQKQTYISGPSGSFSGPITVMVGPPSRRLTRSPALNGKSELIDLAEEPPIWRIDHADALALDVGSLLELRDNRQYLVERPLLYAICWALTTEQAMG